MGEETEGAKTFSDAFNKDLRPIFKSPEEIAKEDKNKEDEEKKRKEAKEAKEKEDQKKNESFFDKIKNKTKSFFNRSEKKDSKNKAETKDNKDKKPFFSKVTNLFTGGNGTSKSLEYASYGLLGIAGVSLATLVVLALLAGIFATPIAPIVFIILASIVMPAVCIGIGLFLISKIVDVVESVGSSKSNKAIKSDEIAKTETKSKEKETNVPPHLRGTENKPPEIEKPKLDNLTNAPSKTPTTHLSDQENTKTTKSRLTNNEKELDNKIKPDIKETKKLEHKIEPNSLNIG